MITIPMVYFVAKLVSNKTRKYFKEQQQELGRLNGHMEEIISGLLVVKAYGQEEQVNCQFGEINNRLCSVGIRAQIWSGYIMPLMNVISNFGFTTIALIGGVLAVNDIITVGLITSFVAYSRQFVRPLNELANTFNAFQSAIAGAERVFEIIDTEPEPQDNKDSVTLINPKGQIVFEKVHFSYEEGLEVLTDINFKIEPGSTVALVGPTGAGKTTIVNLLNRFYDVTAGRILLDGKDIRNYTLNSLRSSFGIVLQDTYLFSGTIFDNIGYGNLNATFTQVEEAAKLAYAEPFIKRLPQGYHTKLLESGSNLSQGERQLLAIARVILADPAILILDEATSSVDTRTELQIQAAMLKLMHGRTSFIIAHRLGTIRHADIIMVVDQGKIMEKGTHDQLIAIKGLYYDLYHNQFVKVFSA